MSQLEIQILHQDYLLTCPDGREAQLLEAVERVDQQFQQMRDSSKLRSRERVCVLLAVNLAYENLELRNQLQALQQQLASCQATADTSATDAERLQAQQALAALARLETQAAHDQTIANQLLARLDQVLSAAPTAAVETQVPETLVCLALPDECLEGEAVTNEVSSADTQLANTDSINLDNDLRMDLPAEGAQSL